MTVTLNAALYLGQCLKLNHVVAKVNKCHFSKNEFVIDYMLLTKTDFPEKKIALSFN